MMATPDCCVIHALAVAKAMALVASPDISGAQKAFDALSLTLAISGRVASCVGEAFENGDEEPW